jgi:predicted  nucleic acid-binding Zn-ribbon protein
LILRLRTGELAALLQLAALDARIRQAERTSLELARHLNEHRVGLETLTRSLARDRDQLASAGRGGGDQERARLERSIADREREMARLAEVLDLSRRRGEPALERVRQSIRAAGAERERILRQLDGALAARYEGLVQRGTHAFIVPVRDGCCGGCALPLPPMMTDALQSPAVTATCPRCERMLYGRGLDA